MSTTETNIAEIDSILDEIAALADQRDQLVKQSQALTAQIKEKAVYAVTKLGARRYSVTAAALISRPTLNAWIDASKS